MSTMKPILSLLAAVLLCVAQPSDEVAIRALEQQWDAATLKGDAEALAKIFADGYIETGSDGTVRTKAEVIGAMKAGKIKYDSARTEDLKVMLYGDAAVVSGKWTGAYTINGKAVKLQERYTNFYVKQAGRWRCVASHGSSPK